MDKFKLIKRDFDHKKLIADIGSAAGAQKALERRGYTVEDVPVMKRILPADSRFSDLRSQNDDCGSFWESQDEGIWGKRIAGYQQDDSDSATYSAKTFWKVC